MKHRALLVLAGIVAVLALIVSLSIASAATRSTGAAQSAAAMKAPPVPNAAAIKAKYNGQSITFIGDSVGGGHVRDTTLAKQFSKQTGIKVKVVPHPAASDASYSQLARAFSSHSSSIDVAMIDAIWPGAFAPFLVDLKPKLGQQAKQLSAGAIQNDTVNRKLVAMPWFGDFGMLYYRTDLLKKYGYKRPPASWTQLFQMAKKIQDGERGTNPNFSGFVFQGNAYEGLTCDALEWIASSGGGHFIDGGKVTINNSKAADILNLIRAQIGVTTPRGVTSYQEGETHTAFIDGNAAFMRNWPYAYSLGQATGSKVKGKFAVAAAAPRSRRQVGGDRRRLAARRLEVLQAPGRLDRVRPLHDEQGRQQVRHDHQLERADVPLARQRSAGQEGCAVPQPGDGARSARHASVQRPPRQVQRGLEGHLPGDQPHPQRRVGAERAAGTPVPAPSAPEEVAQAR